MFLAMMSVPSDWTEVLIVPVILTFIGVFTYFLGWNKERQGRNGSWKWFALVPLVLGMWLGFNDVMRVQDTLFKSYLRHMRKVYYAHYVSLGLPLLATAGLVGWHFASRPKDKSKTPAATQTDAA